jgi:hypothetical protein
MATRLVTTNNILEPLCAICVQYRLFPWSESMIRLGQRVCYNDLFYGSLDSRLTDVVTKKLGK